MKRFWAIFLSLALILTAAPVASAAQQDPTYKEMRRLASRIYKRSLRSSGRDSFHGYCGGFVSHQLYNLRINSWCVSMHGKDHYDYYADLEKTGGGYYPRSYSASEMTMQEALNYVCLGGAKDVYNVMVGFERTNTNAGRKYGHVVLIYGILDGVVYFSESFPLILGGRTRAEGSLITCSIEEFCDYYGRWTKYEGIVVFGEKDDLGGYSQQDTSLLALTRFETRLRSRPAGVGVDGCVELRRIAAGERLQLTGIFTDLLGQQYYRVADGLLAGFVPAQAVGVLRADPSDLMLSDFSVPQLVPPGQKAALSGMVMGVYSDVEQLRIEVLDTENQVVRQKQKDCKERVVSLADWSEGLFLDTLAEGFYTLKIYASTRSVTAQGQGYFAEAFLGGACFQVGGGLFISRPLPVAGFAEDVDFAGWQKKDGSWYFYEGDTAKTGWFTWCGVDHYFNEDGQAATGMVALDGKLHYFSGTGALVKNSRVKLDGTVYQIDSLGVAVKVK